MLCHANERYQLVLSIYNDMLKDEVSRLGLNSILDLSQECRQTKWMTAKAMITLPMRNLAYKNNDAAYILQ
jgi:hypothetical protein